MFANYQQAQPVADTVIPDATWWDRLMISLKLLSGNWQDLGVTDKANIWLAAILLVVVLGCWCLAFRRYWKVRSEYGQRRLVDPYSSKAGLKGELFRLSYRMLVPLLVGLALLNPFLPGVMHPVPSGNRDYVICVAVNRGMGATDVPPADDATATGAPKTATTGTDQFFHEKDSRLDYVRTMIREILLKKVLSKNSVSIIAFQGGSNVLVPMTDSMDWLNDTLDPKNKYGLRTLAAPLGRGQVGGKVSTIASCLQAAEGEFAKNAGNGHEKFLIYFGNGDDISTADWLAKETQKMREANVQGAIYGIGGVAVEIPEYQGDSQQFSGYYKFRSGKEAFSGYSEENLLKLQQLTGWDYTHLDPKHPLNADSLIQQLSNFRMEMSKDYIFDFPLELALGIILLIGLGDSFAWLARWCGRLLRRNRR